LLDTFSRTLYYNNNNNYYYYTIHTIPGTDSANLNMEGATYTFHNEGYEDFNFVTNRTDLVEMTKETESKHCLPAH
jgi:hypothetical protein